MSKQQVEITIEGYRKTGYRVPRRGEWYLMDGPLGDGEFYVRKCNGDVYYARIILVKEEGDE